MDACPAAGVTPALPATSGRLGERAAVELGLVEALGDGALGGDLVALLETLGRRGLAESGIDAAGDEV